MRVAPESCGINNRVVAGLFPPALTRDNPPTRLTHDGHLKQRPAWSPDGAQLVFARHHFGPGKDSSMFS